jgi:glycosyltransferase involved in cell wall biosynthesis
MQKEMLVSIVIATHNMKHVIGETISSIREQDYPDREIIVYDDASTDGTDEYVKHWCGIHYYRSKVNLGVGDAFNEGIAMATGDIIILMCADDLFTNRHVISDIVKSFDDERIGHVSRSYYQFIDGDMRPVRAWRVSGQITRRHARYRRAAHGAGNGEIAPSAHQGRKPGRSRAHHRQFNRPGLPEERLARLGVPKRSYALCRWN